MKPRRPTSPPPPFGLADEADNADLSAPITARGGRGDTRGDKRGGRRGRVTPTVPASSGPRLSAAQLHDRIRETLEPTLNHMGYRLVRVLLSGQTRRIVELMIEPSDGRATTVDDCALVSTQSSVMLDVEDLIPAAYTLEVTSPGIDRPLLTPHDYRRFAGFDARVETTLPDREGRRRWQGRLLGLALVEGAEAVQLRLATDETVALPLSGVAKGRLVLTDDLIDKTMAGWPMHLGDLPAQS